MKSAGFGWEVDDSGNGSFSMSVPITKAITIRGLQLDVAFMCTHPRWLGDRFADLLRRVLGFPRFAYFSEVLASVSVTGVPVAEFGPAKLVGNTTHGGFGGGGALATVILKASPPGSTARSLTIEGLNLAVPAGNSLACFMGHMGYPGDFEMQGVLYYDV
jgi:hypothetical protein